MKLLVKYLEDETKYELDNKDLNDWSEDDIKNILKSKLEVGCLHSIIEDLSPYSFELNLVDSYQCDQCFDTNDDYEGEWNGVEMSWYDGCFGNTITWSCSDERMLELILDNFDVKEIFKDLYHTIGEEVELGEDYDVYEISTH